MLLETFTKALADQTRLRLLLLLANGRELCVCELTQALELAQPKISRHLAILRETGVLQDRKAGLWVYYCLHSELPTWALEMLVSLRQGSASETIFQLDQQRLSAAERQSDGISSGDSMVTRC
ncbi:metalloregulator ArsR/SmtB family transcription factor [Thiothrix winogradskyi]|uniref:Metalloregulator ArsR/SmtB family transcription factor n=1 Tax=Thiothrix winogradskyi TaxID=96472 RepID=A0ABY3SZ67_9GAMM|nr:metalloregulator ArsR/SmtB family transcription factor [Thiothrix winogradskyi]UJS24823.1 metalloregulator ArsR/SmtB family transcription factor [Thiothrix winogradskyi]